MSTPIPFRALAIIAATMLLSGCRKAIDYIYTHPAEELKICRIENLRIGSNFIASQPLDYSNIAISYNSAGAPISMITSWEQPDQQVGTDFHFRYDKKGRLTDYQTNYAFAAYGPGGILLWDRYSYPRNNVIVDSFFAYGDMGLNDPNPPLSSYDRLMVYHTDNQGRIIRSQEGPDSNPSNITNYQYDYRGNLVQPGITYDTNVNPARTNRVWMFVNNDYSINCPQGRYSNFNSYGLPQQNPGFYLFGYLSQQMTITYGCDCNKKDL